MQQQVIVYAEPKRKHTSSLHDKCTLSEQLGGVWFYI